MVVIFTFGLYISRLIAIVIPVMKYFKPQADSAVKRIPASAPAVAFLSCSLLHGSSLLLLP